MLQVAQLKVVSSDLISSHLKPADNSEGIENSATNTDREEVRRISKLMSSHILWFFLFWSLIFNFYFLFLIFLLLLWSSSHVLFFSHCLRSSFPVQPVSFLLFSNSFRLFLFPCFRFVLSRSRFSMLSFLRFSFLSFFLLLFVFVSFSFSFSLRTVRLSGHVCGLEC